MTSKAVDLHRPGRLRRLRPLGAVVALALAAPLGLATVMAAPASAAPFTVRVAGDPATTNSGLWVWGGSDYSQLKGLLQSTDFGDADFVDAGGMSPVLLASSHVDVFFSGAVDGGYTGAEQQALVAWVQAGGVLIS